MKVLVFGGFDLSLLNFRGALLKALVEAGHEVVGAAPAQTVGVPAQLKALGVRFVPVTLARAGMNPLADWQASCALEALFRKEKPDVVLAYTIKPITYGVPAAKRAGVPRIYALITGLGAAFNTGGLKGWVLRTVATRLYRRALRHCVRVIVQNQDIAHFMLEKKVMSDQSRLVVIAGSGIDTGHFGRVAIPEGEPIFLLLARMLRDKGVEEYVSAASSVKKLLPQARFLLAGDTDPNPAAISRDQLDAWNVEGVVEYRSAVSDVRPLLAECSVYVLPSYHEGMPRSVLEAMATGRPVITTDTIGCREMVLNAGPRDANDIRVGDNGLLVPVRRVEPLAAAMLRLASDAGLRGEMGRRGREIVEQHFDVRLINDVMLREMDLLPASEGRQRPPLNS